MVSILIILTRGRCQVNLNRILDERTLNRIYQAAWPNILDHADNSPVVPGGYTINTRGEQFLQGGATLQQVNFPMVNLMITTDHGSILSNIDLDEIPDDDQQPAFVGVQGQRTIYLDAPSPIDDERI